MTAKKQSLLDKGVLITNDADTAKLLAPDNINQEALFEYAREAADFATNYHLPHLDFAVNHYGKPDVAMFDFTSMFQVSLASNPGIRELRCTLFFPPPLSTWAKKGKSKGDLDSIVVPLPNDSSKKLGRICIGDHQVS